MRLIDKDALMKKLGIAYSCSYCSGNTDGIKCSRYTEFVTACKEICEAPEVELERTGIWVEEDDYMAFFHCSVCKNKAGFRTPYCPYCGSKMEW